MYSYSDVASIMSSISIFQEAYKESRKVRSL
jgi:hypothetical protein